MARGPELHREEKAISRQGLPGQAGARREIFGMARSRIKFAGRVWHAVGMAIRITNCHKYMPYFFKPNFPVLQCACLANFFLPNSFHVKKIFLQIRNRGPQAETKFAKAAPITPRRLAKDESRPGQEAAGSYACAVQYSRSAQCFGDLQVMRCFRHQERSSALYQNSLSHTWAQKLGICQEMGGYSPAQEFGRNVCGIAKGQVPDPRHLVFGYGQILVGMGFSAAHGHYSGQ